MLFMQALDSYEEFLGPFEPTALGLAAVLGSLSVTHLEVEASAVVN